MSAEVGYRDTLMTVAAVQDALLGGHPHEVLAGGRAAPHRRPGLWRRSGHPAAGPLVQPPAGLRATPLPRQYGWSLQFGAECRVALLWVEAPEYREVQQAGARVVPAVPSTRASGGT